MSEMERAAMVQQAAGGDDDALQKLILHYHGPLQGTIEGRIKATLRRHIDAEDILQQTYIAAFESIGGCQFDGPGGFYTWLEIIALNRLNQVERDLRRQKRDIGREVHDGSRLPAGFQSDSSYPDLFARLSDGGSTPSRQLSRVEAAAVVMSSLARLTADQRTVIQMRFLQDRPVEEIAAALGKSADAVYMLCHRGLKELQGLLGGISRHLSGL
jgi:RNA polymerase sigma-70 factor (ECF subfamily)